MAVDLNFPIFGKTLQEWAEWHEQMASEAEANGDAELAQLQSDAATALRAEIASAEDVWR